MASKKRNHTTSTQRSQTPAKSEPKPNNENQLNQEKVEILAIGLWTKLNLKKDRFSGKGDNERLKQKTNHRPPHPHHYANNCHRDRISKIPRQVAQPIQAFGRQRHGVDGCTV
jgi:hypothetical protein